MNQIQKQSLGKQEVEAKNVSMTSHSDVEMRECVCMPGGAGQVPGSDDVSGSPGGGADVDSRSRQYAEILGKQRDVAGSHNHLDKVCDKAAAVSATQLATGH